MLLVAVNVALSSQAGLVEQVQRGDLASVEALIAGGEVQVDQPARDGMTALLWAAQANDLPIAEALLEAGTNPNLGNRYGITPLWLAALNRSPEMIKLLLQSGADATALLPDGETALMIAARAGDPESIRLLLAAGADPNASESKQGETAVMWAAGENHPDAIRALVKGGADINRHSRKLDLAAMEWEQVGMVSTTLASGGWTAAMYATRQNSAEALAALIDLGADLNEQDADGTTALSLAIMNQHYDLAAVLLEAGADPDIADRTGANALYGAVAMASFRSDIGRPAIPSFDKLSALDIVRLALEHGADPNARLVKPVIGRHHDFGDAELGEGATALMRAAKSGDLKSMNLLLEAGADPTLQLAKGGLTVFDLAAGKGRSDANEEVQDLLRGFAGSSR
jgi:ankyrin repeat protein